MHVELPKYLTNAFNDLCPNKGMKSRHSEGMSVICRNSKCKMTIESLLVPSDFAKSFPTRFTRKAKNRCIVNDQYLASLPQFQEAGDDHGTEGPEGAEADDHSDHSH